MSELRRFVRVAVPAPLLEPLVYEVPEALAASAVAGARVRVPLGRRRVVGLVLGPVDTPPEGLGIKAIDDALDPEGRPALTADLLETLLWTIDYYLAPPGDVARAALPAALSPSREGWIRITAEGREAARRPGAPAALTWLASRPAGRARPRSLQARLERAGELAPLIDAGLVDLENESTRSRGAPALRRVVEAAEGVREDPDAALERLARTPARRAALRASLERGALAPAELARVAEVGAAALRHLVQDGFLVERLVEAAGSALPDTELPVHRPATLSRAQEEAVAHIRALIDGETFRQVVLYGVTGSGKTEVYLRAAEHALGRGRGVLFLVPEIGLTPQVARAFASRFGDDVSVLHSGMNDRQRFDAWQRARKGEARIVVGARSALFAPLERPGLIVVDEEHDGGFKQEESPRYHARDLALVRGRASGAPVVLGSATPSIECWGRAQEGRADLLRLPERVGAGALAEVELVDMRVEFEETGDDRPLSRALRRELDAALARGEQAMVLLNRRGYARSLLCRACGEAVMCTECSLPLTWHKVGQQLRCHYCDHARPRPETCPECESEYLMELGSGTQHAEELIEDAFPGARVGRLDRDTVRSPRRLAATLGRFGRGEIDLLVGTQMIAKGHHFPRVTVVGVLSADASLALPDFRAAERTFGLLTQVAGRAGRGDLPGKVVVQAFRPEHPALQSALRQDYDTFAAREWPGRKALHYPPAAAMANLIVRDADETRAQTRAQVLARRIRVAGEGKVVVLGPAPAPISRLRGEHRMQVIARARRRQRLAAALKRALLETIGEQGVMPRWLAVDVDPYHLL